MDLQFDALKLLGQVLGIAAAVMTVISYQVNTKKQLLFVHSISIVFICISYLLLGAITGFVLNVGCLCRNICCIFQKEGGKASYISAVVFSVLLGVLGIFSWQGMISLLLILALIINTVFMSIGKPQLLRYSILLTSTMVIIYNVVFFSVGGILNESIAISSSVIGILRFRRKEPIHK